jgi:hypothetical protein
MTKTKQFLNFGFFITVPKSLFGVFLVEKSRESMISKISQLGTFTIVVAPPLQYQVLYLINMQKKVFHFVNKTSLNYRQVR